MEQLLNLAWLLVAISAMGGWLWRRRRAGRKASQARVVWQIVALCVVLTFLFYAISITDDLHWSVIAAEASEGTRKLAKSFASRAPASSFHGHAAARLFASIAFSLHKLGAAAQPSVIGLPATAWCQDACSRAPPPLC